MGVYTRSDGSWLSRRGAFLVLLVGFHIVLIWALKSGFAVRLVQQITQPITAVIINETPPEEPPPPVLEPELELQEAAIEIPPLLVDIQIPPPPTALQAPIGNSSQGRAGRVVIRTKAGVAAMPKISTFYPPASRSAGEAGTVQLKLCYGNDGRIVQAVVAQTSGFPRLDEAAVKLGAQVRMRPATVDGKAVADCMVLPILMSPDAA
jgi:periplasmic protein TonB